MSRLQGKSKSGLEEKDKIVHTEATEATGENPLEIDLTKYHEQRAGSLVLDPKCVCFLLFC